MADADGAAPKRRSRARTNSGKGRGREVAVAYVSLSIDGRDVKPGIEDALGATPEVADKKGRESGKRFGDGFSTAALVLVGAAVAKAASQAIWSSVEGAASTQEFSNSVGQLLGEASADKVREWGETLADTRGISNRTALEAVKNFGVFAQAAGKGGDEAAAFSQELVELASDLAAFNDTTPEEALAAIRSGLAGETEPLRRYGVLLGDAQLRQKAFEMGIYDGTGVLNAQQKVLATHAVLMSQTTTQQGAFARESEGLNQVQARLNARLTNLSDTIGSRLLPVFESFLGGPVMYFVTWLSETPGALETIALVIGITLVGAFTAWAASIWAANAALLASPATWIILGIIGAITLVVLAIRDWDSAWAVISRSIVAGLGLIIGSLMAIPALVAAAVDSIGQIFGMDWGLLKGVTDFTNGAINHVGNSIIPGLATGGSVTRAGTVLVGEAGPELLHLGPGAMVQPLEHYSRMMDDFEPAANAASGGGLTVNQYNPVAERGSESLRKSAASVTAGLNL